VENQPKKLITRILEFACLLALSAFLIRLAVHYILEVWPILVILVIVAVGTATFLHIRKNRARW
jgi:hypothetical protein